MDTEKQRQRRHDKREANREQKHQKRAAIHDAYRVANQQRMVSRKALEWIRTLKASWFLHMKNQTCFTRALSRNYSTEGVKVILDCFLKSSAGGIRAN